MTIDTTVLLLFYVIKENSILGTAINCMKASFTENVRKVEWHELKFLFYFEAFDDCNKKSNENLNLLAIFSQSCSIHTDHKYPYLSFLSNWNISKWITQEIDHLTTIMHDNQSRVTYFSGRTTEESYRVAHKEID